MRTVLFSKTFARSFDDLLAQGEIKFGADLVRKKRALVVSTIHDFLARHPDAKRRHPRLNLVVYPISKTPFVVLYDFNDADLRMHFIFHEHSSLEDFDPTSAEW